MNRTNTTTGDTGLPTAMAPLDESACPKRRQPSLSSVNNNRKKTRSGKDYTSATTQDKEQQSEERHEHSGASLPDSKAPDSIVNNNNNSDDESEDGEGSNLDNSVGSSANDTSGQPHDLDDGDDDDGDDDDDDNAQEADVPFTEVATTNSTTPVSSVTTVPIPTEDLQTALSRVMKKHIFPKVKFIGKGDEGYARLQFNTTKNSLCSLILHHCKMPATDEGKSWWKLVRPQIRGLLSGVQNNALKAMSVAFTSE